MSIALPFLHNNRTEHQQQLQDRQEVPAPSQSGRRQWRWMHPDEFDTRHDTTGIDPLPPWTPAVPHGVLSSPTSSYQPHLQATDGALVFGDEEAEGQDEAEVVALRSCRLVQEALLDLETQAVSLAAALRSNPAPSSASWRGISAQYWQWLQLLNLLWTDMVQRADLLSWAVANGVWKLALEEFDDADERATATYGNRSPWGRLLALLKSDALRVPLLCYASWVGSGVWSGRDTTPPTSADSEIVLGAKGIFHALWPHFHGWFPMDSKWTHLSVSVLDLWIHCAHSPIAALSWEQQTGRDNHREQPPSSLSGVPWLCPLCAVAATAHSGPLVSVVLKGMFEISSASIDRILDTVLADNQNTAAALHVNLMRSGRWFGFALGGCRCSLANAVGTAVERMTSSAQRHSHCQHPLEACRLLMESAAAQYHLVLRKVKSVMPAVVVSAPSSTQDEQRSHGQTPHEDEPQWRRRMLESMCSHAFIELILEVNSMNDGDAVDMLPRGEAYLLMHMEALETVARLLLPKALAAGERELNAALPRLKDGQTGGAGNALSSNVTLQQQTQIKETAFRDQHREQKLYTQQMYHTATGSINSLLAGAEAMLPQHNKRVFSTPMFVQWALLQFPLRNAEAAGGNIFHWCCQRNYSHLLRKFMTEFAQWEASSVQLLVDHSQLQAAPVRGSNRSSQGCVTTLTSCLNARDANGFTPLHYALLKRLSALHPSTRHFQSTAAGRAADGNDPPVTATDRDQAEISLYMIRLLLIYQGSPSIPFPAVVPWFPELQHQNPLLSLLVQADYAVHTLLASIVTLGSPHDNHRPSTHSSFPSFPLLFEDSVVAQRLQETLPSLLLHDGQKRAMASNIPNSTIRQLFQFATDHLQHASSRSHFLLYVAKWVWQSEVLEKLHLTDDQVTSVLFDDPAGLTTTSPSTSPVGHGVGVDLHQRHTFALKRKVELTTKMQQKVYWFVLVKRIFRCLLASILSDVWNEESYLFLLKILIVLGYSSLARELRTHFHSHAHSTACSSSITQQFPTDRITQFSHRVSHETTAAGHVLVQSVLRDWTFNLKEEQDQAELTTLERLVAGSTHGDSTQQQPLKTKASAEDAVTAISSVPTPPPSAAALRSSSRQHHPMAHERFDERRGQHTPEIDRKAQKFLQKALNSTRSIDTQLSQGDPSNLRQQPATAATALEQEGHLASLEAHYDIEREELKVLVYFPPRKVPLWVILPSSSSLTLPTPSPAPQQALPWFQKCLHDVCVATYGIVSRDCVAECPVQAGDLIVFSPLLSSGQTTSMVSTHVLPLTPHHYHREFQRVVHEDVFTVSHSTPPLDCDRLPNEITASGTTMAKYVRIRGIPCQPHLKALELCTWENFIPLDPPKPIAVDGTAQSITMPGEDDGTNSSHHESARSGGAAQNQAASGVTCTGSGLVVVPAPTRFRWEWCVLLRLRWGDTLWVRERNSDDDDVLFRHQLAPTWEQMLRDPNVGVGAVEWLPQYGMLPSGRDHSIRLGCSALVFYRKDTHQLLGVAE